MNIANVMERFALLCGIEKSEAASWRTIIDDAGEYINRRLLIENPDASQQKRIELLTAAYAYKTYCKCNENNVSAFTAGEVHITSPQRKSDTAETLWQRLCAESRDLIRGGNYLFGRVMT